LTPCCGLEVQKPTQALKSVKSATVGFQISTLIFEKQIMEGVLYKYTMKNILRMAKFLPQS
jgi:hypothetical protein